MRTDLCVLQHVLSKAQGSRYRCVTVTGRYLVFRVTPWRIDLWKKGKIGVTTGNAESGKSRNIVPDDDNRRYRLEGNGYGRYRLGVS